MSASTRTTLPERLLGRLRLTWWWSRVGLLRAVVVGAWKDDITGRAAAIAHFGLLSLVPVTLLLAYALGTILRGEQARARAIELLSEVLPYPEAIADVTQRMVLDRGTIGVVGVVSLLWLSARTFIALQRALDSILRIRHDDKRRAAWLNSLISIGLMLVLGTFAYLSQLASSVLTPFLIDWVNWLPGIELGSSVWAAVVSAVLSLGLSIWFMYLLYRWAPSARVQRRSAAIGALVAGLLWEAAKVGFVLWYGRYARIDRFYGAMGGLVLVTLWSYVTAWIVLLGAEVTVAHARIVLRATSTEDARESIDDADAVPADQLEVVQPPGPGEQGEVT